jgi:hypothetical protein
MPETPFEELEQFLEQLDMPPEGWRDKEQLRETLEDFLKRKPSDVQVESLWDVWETHRRTKWDNIYLQEHGVRRVTVHYRWGRATRYAIQGLPGLWEKWAVERIREEEGW